MPTIAGSVATEKLVTEIVEFFGMTRKGSEPPILVYTSGPELATFNGGRRHDDGYDFMTDVQERWRFRAIPSVGEWPFHCFTWRTVDPADDVDGGEFRYLLLSYCEGESELLIFETKVDLKAHLERFAYDG